MTDLSRRKLIASRTRRRGGRGGLGVAAALRGVWPPPDHGGLWGAGETLNYASYKLLTRH